MDLFRSDGISQGNMARAGAEQATAVERLQQKEKVDRLNKHVLDLQGKLHRKQLRVSQKYQQKEYPHHPVRHLRNQLIVQLVNLK